MQQAAAGNQAPSASESGLNIGQESILVPWPRTALIGRERERAAGHAILLDRAVPLLTLTGPGGVGKTRLAMAIAHEVSPSFAAGTVFVGLAAITDPELVLAAIALAVGVRDTGDRPLADQVAAVLRPKQLLLVLDNCEQALAAALIVARLLAACPALQIVATSRAPLRIHAEQLFPVPPLALPDAGQPASVAQSASAASVELFVNRGQAIDPAFSLTDGNAAAVAGAAATVLGYLFPEAKRRLADLAAGAAESRLWAGASYRSDIEAGLALGRAIGDLAIGRGKADGSDVVWAGTRPSSTGGWEPTPPEFRTDPLEPLAGTWDTWVLADGAALRPASPPAWGSTAWRSELRAVQAAVAARTPKQAAAVHRWAGGPGTVTPAGLWVAIARELIVRDRLDSVRAAQALALTTIAMYDGFVCCWDAKFAYWTARPITADPSLDMLIPTPPFPSYTSGHSTISAAAATVLGGLFPLDAETSAAKARQAKDSQLWAGIHFPADNETGATGGKLIGRLVLAAGGTENVAAP